MPWTDIAAFNLTLLLTAVAAVLLAGLLLVIEIFASQRTSRQAPGVIIVLLAALAIAGCCLPQARPIALGCVALATLVLAAWTLHFEVVRRQIARLATPKFVWGIVLLVGLIASRYLAAHVLHALDLHSNAPALDLEDVPIRQTEAITDAGNRVALFHFKMHSTAAEIEQFIALDEGNLTQIIRLTEPNSAANCHGWVFTDGKYGIRDPEIGQILKDNGYVEITTAREGDLAIYTSDSKITHSGIVRIAEQRSPILVESKWGPFGVYLHALDRQPFKGQCHFYRSPRSGHQLTLRNTSGDSDVAIDIGKSAEHIR